MTNTAILQCDGCGQETSPEHIGRRLQRLEWTTRYRPVHITTLFLGAAAPKDDANFLYAPGGKFNGEAGLILQASGISCKGNLPEGVLTEFQRGGFFLAHVLECPLERTDGNSNQAALQALLEKRVPSLRARMRRSLKPKRIVLVSGWLRTLVKDLQDSALGCPLILDGYEPFALDSEHPEATLMRLREALETASASQARSV